MLFQLEFLCSLKSVCLIDFILMDMRGCDIPGGPVYDQIAWKTRLWRGLDGVKEEIFDREPYLWELMKMFEDIMIIVFRRERG